MKTFCTWLLLVVAAIATAHALDAPVLGHTLDSIEWMPMMVGATLGGNVLTLADHAKRVDPDGRIATIVEMLAMDNDVVRDMTFIQGNLTTGHRTTVRTGLPTVTWRQLNQGVQPSKSTTAQSDDHAALLESWVETDAKLVQLSDNPAAFRLTEASAHLEAMSQEAASTLWYGNAGAAPEEFTGLAPRYNSLSGANAQNIIDAGGTGSDNTSIWLVTWGPNAVTGIYPRGSQAGLVHEDLGLETAETTAGIAGNRLRVYRDRFEWTLGLTVADWRAAIRICNIDVSNLVAQSSAANLTEALIKATWRPAGSGGRRMIYMNRTVGQYLDIQRRDDVSVGGQLGFAEVDGVRRMTFRGIPIGISDAITETEARVT